MDTVQTQTHYLYHSAIFVSRQPTLVTTILGSCVAVCIFDKRLEFGGINHYMLPLWNGTGLPSPKYGNVAIPKLIEKMVSLGSREEDLIAKVVGGGEVLVTNNDMFHIGDRNIQIAHEILSEKNIKIAGESVGGTRGRKILYDTATGTIKQIFITKH